MPYTKGRQQYLGLSQETTRLTAQTTGFNYYPWTSLSAKNVSEFRQDNSAFGRRSAFTAQTLSGQYGELNIGGKLDADNILPLLHMVTGTATPTTALGATTWVMPITQTLEAPTYTVQYLAGDEGHRRQRGVLGSKLELNFTPEDSEFTFEGGGLIEDTGTTLTPTTTQPTRYLLGRHVAVSHADTLAGLSSGTALTDVKSCRVMIDTGRDPKRHQVLGQIGLNNNTFDGFSMEIEFTTIAVGSQAATIQGWNDNNTLRAIRIDVDASNLPVIGTSTLRPRLTIDVPPSTVTVERSFELDDFIMQTCKVTVHFADQALITLINSIATI
jgi:hypothetical protein